MDTKMTGCGIFVGLLVAAACGAVEASAMGIEKRAFGKTAEGEAVDLYTLSNGAGMRVGIMTYGGIVVSLEVPDRDGKSADVVLGFDTLEGYLGESPYFGALIGRYGNRIANGLFTLDGNEYKLEQNNGPNSLHGGLKGFDKRVWSAEPITEDGTVGLRLRYTSADGEEGYPGTLKCTVTYRLTEDNALKIDYLAETDKATPINLTNHSYFNLAGHDAGSILGHEMMIAADTFLSVDETLIPTGELRTVADTPFDFREPIAIGARINADYDQLKFYPGGYDHCHVLRNQDGDVALGARVADPKSGRVMEVYTTEPGVQFYSGNFLDGVAGKGGAVYYERFGFCLETQHYPDSPNQPAFPSTILKPGQQYTSSTVYKFSAK
jgi:aldose 1-epimerase